jgi:hypothetical protein
MNHPYASALATVTAAIACVAAIASGNAYAESPTIDNTPFVSTRSRAEVQAEVIAQRDIVRAGASEWALQYNNLPQHESSYTSEQARSAYMAARDEVAAMTSEDSGSSFLARRAFRINTGTTVAGDTR